MNVTNLVCVFENNSFHRFDTSSLKQCFNVFQNTTSTWEIFDEIAIEEFWSDGVDDVENEVVEHQIEEPVKPKKKKIKDVPVLPVPNIILKNALSGKCPECLHIILTFPGRIEAVPDPPSIVDDTVNDNS